MKNILSVLLIVGIVSCGGSGSGSGLQNQTVTFSNTSPGSLYVGQQLANPASGTGTGAITYSSSSNTVATVDANGTVTANAVGSATITATIAADSTYASASASYSLTVELPPTLTFTVTGTAGLVVGETFNNPALSPSTGAITYSSSNSAIASVNANGQVTANTVGTVTITADQVAAGSHPAYTTNYQVDVVTSSFTMTSWIGKNNTKVDITAGTDGIEFYRSTDANCNLSNYSTCANGQLNILNGTTVTDTALTSTRSAFYTFKHGAHEVKTEMGNQLFSPRVDSEIKVFKGKLIVIGGSPSNQACLNDVWTSADGKAWSQLTSDAAYPKRDNHKVSVMNNRLWLVGGQVTDPVYDTCSVASNDVWYSDDGVNWTQATANAGFPVRSKHALFTFNNKLWVVGGVDSDGITDYNDVWSSSDGINWTQETASAAFSERSLHNIVEYNNTLYLVGGQDGSSTLKDVWSSTDGINWTQVTANGGFNRADKLAVFDNKLWIVNITFGTNLELWSSSDGSSWTKAPLVQIFTTRYFPELVAFDNKLFMIAGRELASNYYNDAWYITTDVDRWYRSTPGPDFALRYGHAGITFNNKMWIINGYDNDYFYSDIWSSTDGFTWTEEVANAPFIARYNHKVIEFNNKLWLTGGYYFGGRRYDLWSSPDGINWTSETPDTVLTDRYDYSLVVFNNKLWLHGGKLKADDSYLDEVWSTTDGLNWTQEMAANYPERSDTNVVAYNNKLWLVGGSNTANTKLNDVWSSTDGITWTQATASAAFNARVNAQFYVHNNKLWMTTGSDGVGGWNLKDVWSTTDGVTWTIENPTTAFTARINNPVVELNGEFWMLGGKEFVNTFHKDLWKSSDGVNWYTPQQHSLSFP